MNMLKLSINELKLVAKSRTIKGYKSMSKERLLSALNESELVESENNFDDERLKNIKKDFNELGDIKDQEKKKKEIRKNLYDIKNSKKSFNTKSKRN